MGAVLGVSTLSYLPYCVFNIASPVLSVLYGITGFRVARAEPDDDTIDLAEPADTAPELAPKAGGST